MVEDPTLAALEAARRQALADLATVAFTDVEQQSARQGIVFAETLLAAVSPFVILNSVKRMRQDLRRAVAKAIEAHDPAGVISRDHRRAMMDEAEKLFISEIQRAAAEAAETKGPAN